MIDYDYHPVYFSQKESKMSNYVIVTDTNCDISPDILKEWGVQVASLTFRFTDSNEEYTNLSMPASEFYAEMRKGRVAKTAAVNTENFSELFDSILKEGNDVLYIGFSSGLSNTYNAGRLAAEAMREKYPERKIFTVDTLAASAGEGLALYLTVQKKNAGATIEEAVKYAEEIHPQLSIWFTVDDLEYLKRGGRISPTTAFVGNALGIKPILHMDENGKLVSVSKVRGRKAAIAALASKYAELGIYFISHGDCYDDAKLLADMIEEKSGVKVHLISDVGPSIGAHSGPGTIALFFIGTQK